MQIAFRSPCQSSLKSQPRLTARVQGATQTRPLTKMYAQTIDGKAIAGDIRKELAGA